MIPFSSKYYFNSFRTENKLDHEQDRMEESGDDETIYTSLENK